MFINFEVVRQFIMLKFLMLNFLFMCMCSFKVNILKCLILMFKNVYFIIFWQYLIFKLFIFFFRLFFQGRMSVVELEDSIKVRGLEFMILRVCLVIFEFMLIFFSYYFLFFLRFDFLVYFLINIYYSNILVRIKVCRFCL